VITPPAGPPSLRVPERVPDAFRTPSAAQRGLVAGAVAAATLLGLLIGTGRRAGTPWRPVNAAASTIIGARADGVWDFDLGVTPTGVAVVLVLSVAAGVVVAWIASSFRRIPVVVAAAGVALLGYLLHLHVLVRTSGGLAVLLSVGEMRAVYVALALSLVVGMSFAFFPGTEGHER
jgi:hypothetical protein